MNTSSKKIITVLLFSSFLMMALFSFSAVMHGSDGQMSGDCLFSVGSTVLCPQGALIVALHHISVYTSLFNVPVNLGLTTIVFFLLCAIGVLLMILVRPPLLEPQPLVRAPCGPLPANSYKKTISNWLSLFEHSPSFF